MTQLTGVMFKKCTPDWFEMIQFMMEKISRRDENSCKPSTLTTINHSFLTFWWLISATYIILKSSVWICPRFLENMSEAFCQTQLLVLRPLKLTLPKLKKNGLSDYQDCLPSCLGAPRSERQCISRCSHDLSIRHRDLAGGPVYHHADCICWDLGLHQHGGVSNTYEIRYRFDKVCRHITIATCLICFFPRLEVKHWWW